MQPERFFDGEEFILGDSGYPAGLPWLATPYKPSMIGANEVWKTAFNDDLSSARVRVEHAFGRLKGAYPVLDDTIDARPVDFNLVMMAAIILHNRQIDPELV